MNRYWLTMKPVLNELPIQRQDVGIDWEDVGEFFRMGYPVRSVFVLLGNLVGSAVMVLGNAIVYPFCVLSSWAYVGVSEDELEESLQRRRTRREKRRGSELEFWQEQRAFDELERRHDAEMPQAGVHGAGS